MGNLAQQIEQMLARVNELSGNEQGLIRALGDALNRIDQQLLDEVRSVTLEHEMRRGVVLMELQTLASRIGALPAPREPLARASIAHELPPYEAIDQQPETALACGDWRRAANNIQDELDFPLNGHSPH
ncbi:MAG: hypothetical protein ACM31O_04420 [Bacteroidota bacterium]|jgi:hypothetical protein